MTAGGRRAEVRWRRWPAPGSWWPWLAWWAAVGLGIRLAAILGRPDRVPGGDSYYYHHAANLLVTGKGFINPFLYYGGAHQSVPTASFPPGFVFVLAIASAVGFKSFLAHRIWCAVIGSAAIVACGLAGREIAGRRVGLIAASVVAVYPNLWMSDELGLSEALTPLVVAVVLLAAYRFWKHPGWGTVIWLGASIGLAALARDELGLLAILVLVPLALSAKTLSWGRRPAVLAVGGLSALLVVAPWVGYNLSRFQNPVFISSGLGVTLASANCSTTYNGPFQGYWSYPCALAALVRSDVDESEQGAEAQKYAMHFVRTHASRILPVEAARFGRTFGLFHPLQQVRLDAMIETRPHRWALVGLAMYYLMLPLAVGGAVILRRRRVPVLPLLAVGLDVVASTAITFGNTRYRTAFEIPLVLASAVMLEWMWPSRKGPGTVALGDDAESAEAASARLGASGRAGGGSFAAPSHPAQPAGGAPSEVAGPARTG